VTRQINTDGTDKLFSYEGCGCAGGQVTTIQGEALAEGRRKQKVYEDILGRTYKTETLNWDGSVYSTSKSFFNGRDQVTLARQYAGADNSSTFQDTTMTYDGHGRLKTNHRPEQDANTATTYNYYNDDRIQQVVDARGATVNYSYDNRGLTTQVSTTSPNLSTIPVTPTVTYAYDNLGNRTLMTDGLGNVTYEYNQLSQMMAETRQFNDNLPNAPMSNNRFQIQYSYSLGGQLKSVTDPYGQQINYSHDKIGRLNSVTGSSFAGVTNYATNSQYRAWGGLKRFEFGNNTNSETTYNNRLEVESFKVADASNPALRTFDKQYQYYADGRLKFIGNANGGIFKTYDRLYVYDQVGRIRFAKSGVEATGGTVSNVSTYSHMPYRQEYSFDSFGNLGVRYSTKWNVENWDFFQIYTNNRSNWINYDADGNEVYSMSDQISFQYSAGGKMVRTGKAESHETELAFDGNGLEVKRSQRDWNTTSNAWDGWKTNYQIRSTLLGQTISEVTFEGKKKRSFVIGNNGVIARQVVEENGTQKVSFEFTDPSGNSIRTTNDNGNAELDALGNNVGMGVGHIQQPRGDSPPSPFDQSVAGTNSMCSREGITGHCDIVENLTTNIDYGTMAYSQIHPDAYQQRGGERYISPNIEGAQNRFLTANYDSQYLGYLVGQQTTQFTSTEWVQVDAAVNDAISKLSNKKCSDTIKAGTVNKPKGLPGNGDPKKVLEDIFKRAQSYNSGVVMVGVNGITGEITNNRGIEKDNSSGAIAHAGTAENSKGYMRLTNGFFNLGATMPVFGPQVTKYLQTNTISPAQLQSMVILHELKHIITGDYNNGHDSYFHHRILRDCFGIKLPK
jgi:YD repeat-containing protein